MNYISIDQQTSLFQDSRLSFKNFDASVKERVLFMRSVSIPGAFDRTKLSKETANYKKPK